VLFLFVHCTLSIVHCRRVAVISLFKNKAKKIELTPENLPRHVAVIMDGNGRWAKKRGLPRSAGHIKGAKTFQSIARYGNKIGLRYMTAYAFSTENWRRPPDEIKAIMNLLRDYLKDASNYKYENIKTIFIGERAQLDADITELMEDAERESRDATGMTLNIAVNYGGRAEILRAVRSIADEAAKGLLDARGIDENAIGSRLYTAGQPDPDLIIRPSGEYRLSNFLVWQSAYAEFWYDNVLWPDFTVTHFERALMDYATRSRRFGGI